jgi:hypothetical protein
VLTDRLASSAFEDNRYEGARMPGRTVYLNHSSTNAIETPGNHYVFAFMGSPVRSIYHGFCLPKTVAR